jgi:hypothetical protein
MGMGIWMSWSGVAWKVTFWVMGLNGSSGDVSIFGGLGKVWFARDGGEKEGLYL